MKQSKHSKLAQRYNTLVTLAQSETDYIHIIKGQLTYLIDSKNKETSLDNKQMLDYSIYGNKSSLRTHRIIYNAYMREITLTKSLIKAIQKQNSNKVK